MILTIAGRLGGSEMGRVDTVREGRPRRAPISIRPGARNTTFGVIGVKVSVYLGEVMPGNLPRYSVEAG